jgi:hypothetical protein
MIMFTSSCKNSTGPGNSAQDQNTASHHPNFHDNELKVGGLYLTKDESGIHSIYKIIAIDDFAIHLRMYADKFQNKPTQVSSKNLKVTIGHIPMDAEGFLAENPELLIIENVTNSELEGYNIYLQEMQK